VKKELANIITASRILCSVIMLFFPTFSSGFYAAYILCGVSDMTDGFVARRTNSCSEFGERLDTVADFLFLAAAMAKLAPVISVLWWLWLWIAAIAVVKFGGLLWGWIACKSFFPCHSLLNKVTGLILFLLPLTMGFFALNCGAVVVCLVASCAAVHEFLLIRRSCRASEFCVS